MKILHIIQRYYPAGGGAENYMRILSEYFAQDPMNKVDVWTSDAIDVDALWDVDRKKIDVLKEVVNCVNIRRFKVAPFLLSNRWVNKGFRFILKKVPVWSIRCLSSSPTVFGMLVEALKIKKNTYDIVHVSAMPYTSLFYIGNIIAKRSGAKLVYSPFVHIGESEADSIRKLYLKNEMPKLYGFADAIFVQTDAEKEAIIGLSKRNSVELDSGKFIKLGMGIYPDKLSGGDGKRFRDKYKISCPIVFYVGAKVIDKGVVNLIKAMQLVWERGYKAKLVLAGNETREYRNFWSSVDKKTKQNVISLDYISDEEKLDIFSAGDIFSMVSKSDSFGIVYLEAWYYKKPVIGCRTPVISEIVEENIDGLLVGFNDISALSGKIIGLLENSELRTKLGENGYKKVLKNNTWEKKLAIVQGVYSDLH